MVSREIQVGILIISLFILYVLSVHKKQVPCIPGKATIPIIDCTFASRGEVLRFALDLFTIPKPDRNLCFRQDPENTIIHGVLPLIDCLGSSGDFLMSANKDAYLHVPVLPTISEFYGKRSNLWCYPSACPRHPGCLSWCWFWFGIPGWLALHLHCRLTCYILMTVQVLERFSWMPNLRKSALIYNSMPLGIWV